MPANLENSAVATGLEKVSFHSNPKERQKKKVEPEEEEEEEEEEEDTGRRIWY